MKVIFVVGNKFRDFSSNEEVMTIGELQQLTRQGQLDMLPSGTLLLAGQGVREYEIQQILDAAEAMPASASIDLRGLLCRPARVSRLHTHKHQLQNSIISHPVRLSDTHFEMALMLDERSELMSDHQTGQHIPGMILIEAARQTFLAVTEEYFIGPDDHHRYYFVINSIDVRFQGFVFPIDATLRYEIVDQNIENRDRMRFDTLITVEQGGKSATQIAIQFTAFLADKIEGKERQQAQLALQQQAGIARSEAVAT